MCLPGTQPLTPTPARPSDCAPLACAAPLRPAAYGTAASDSAALQVSSNCVGCAPGSAGAPGSCAVCAPGEFCPGLLSRPLLNFSSAAGPPGGAPARPLPWAACPQLSAAALPAAAPRGGGGGGGGGSPLSRAQQAAAAGGAFLVALLFVGLASARLPPPRQPPSLLALAARVAQALDMYRLSHLVEVEKSPVNRPTAAGGVFTLLGLTGIATYAAYMVLQWQDSNTLVQRSLDAVDGGVWGAAGALPWAAAPLPGAPAASGLLLRLTLDGEPGMCGAPLAPPAASGLLRGGWAQVGAVADCGGSGAAQLTFACADCDVGPDAALSFSFHYSCQSLLLEAAAVPAYPAGAVSVLVAEAAATAAAPGGGGLLAALEWEVPPLLTQSRDRVSVDGAASKRGYALTIASAAPRRPPLPRDEAGNLLIRPIASAVNVTIALPLSSTFVITSLTPLVPWTQLLANIVGLSGVLSVVGVLFGVAEGQLGGARGKGAPLQPGAPPPGGAAGADAAAEIAAMRRQLDALEERLRRAQQGGPRGAPAAEVTVNPLLLLLPAPEGALPAAAEEPPRAVVWQQHSDDAGDVWFTSSTGDSAWALPPGAALAGAAGAAAAPSRRASARRSRSSRSHRRLLGEGGGAAAP